MRRALAVVFTASWMAGCAGRGEIVVDPFDLAEASSAPKIDSVSELGGGDVVLTADLPTVPAGDGSATVGEALWVHGQSFGRRPTVNVAGQPGVVLARTTDGGLVTRVPPGAPAGNQVLVVINDRGSGEFPIIVRRLVAAVPPGGGSLSVADLGNEGPRVARVQGTAATTVAARGSLLQVGADGRAAYVVEAATGRLQVFELPAQWGPRAAAVVEPESKAGDPVLGFAAAAHAPTLLVARAREVVVLDATSPLRPTRGRPRPWPSEVTKAGVARVALAPDGRTVAVGTDDNRLMLVDVGRPDATELRATLAVAPEARLPVIADVAFSPDGRTIWLALGDTVKSRAVSPQPTEIVAVRVGPAASGPAPALTLARRVTVEEAERPVHLATGRARPLQSGASIRLPPERATVYLTAFRRGAGAAVFRLGAEDHATLALEAPANVDLGGAEPSPDGVWLMTPTSGGGELGLLTVAADGRAVNGDGRAATPVRTRLGVGGPGARGAAAVPALSAQP